MKWNNNSKEKIAYGLAILVACVGLGLSISGFVINPTGEIHDSVQWVLGESLVFAAAVLGISLHARNTINTLKENIDKHIDRRLKNEGEEDKIE